jgi:hypothetical protein
MDSSLQIATRGGQVLFFSQNKTSPGFPEALGVKLEITF